MIHRVSGLLMPETVLECMDIPCSKCALTYTMLSTKDIDDKKSVCLLDRAMQ